MTLQNYYFEEIDETLYTAKLKNGLTLYIIPKENYVEKTAIMTVSFGSLDSKLTSEQNTNELPEGIAHFLEHKLFEDKYSGDLSILFTENGAESNAYTTFDRTSYYFSSANHFSKNLKLLQRMMVDTYFTPKSINRERDIITQEIDMYQDDADYQAYQGILSNLFPDSILSVDIAGTKQTISIIDQNNLEFAHQRYYHPSNLTLVLVGDIDPMIYYHEVTQYQKQLAENKQKLKIERNIEYHPVITSRTIQMDVAMPKLMVGYRQIKNHNLKTPLKNKIALRLLFAMLFGWTSKTYQEWYQDKKIDDSFDIEIEIQKEFQFIIISSDTMEPIALSSSIHKKIKLFKESSDLSEEHLKTVKREMYGDFLRSFDSVEQLANQFVNYLSDEEHYFDIPKYIRELTFDMIINIGEEYFTEADSSDFTVFPK